MCSLSIQNLKKHTVKQIRNRRHMSQSPHPKVVSLANRLPLPRKPLLSEATLNVRQDSLFLCSVELFDANRHEIPPRSTYCCGCGLRECSKCVSCFIYGLCFEIGKIAMSSWKIRTTLNDDDLK